MGKLTSDETMTAVLSYIGILVIIPFIVVKNKNDFIKFHLRQGIALCIAEIAAWIILSLILGPFMWLAMYYLIRIVWIIFLAVSILAIVKALSGQKWEIPLIKELANKMNFV